MMLLESLVVDGGEKFQASRVDFKHLVDIDERKE